MSRRCFALCKLGNREEPNWYDWADLDGLAEPDYDEYDDILDFDCSMTSDGLCGKAGSEECDWECPFRDRSC